MKLVAFFLMHGRKKKVFFRLANIRGRLFEALGDEMKEVGSCINLKSRETPFF